MANNDAGRVRPTQIREVVELLGDDVKRVEGALDRTIASIGPLSLAASGMLTYCRYTDSRLEAALSSPASALIVADHPAAGIRPDGPTVIVVENPRLSFIRVAASLFRSSSEGGIHPTAVIDPSARVDPTATIGPYCVLGPRCSVGPNSVLRAHVVLHRDVRIGANTRIDPQVVVGGEGFGFERDKDGQLINFPHIGGVVIGDNVDIGAGVCIDRGTFEDTIISDGVRIDNLTHVSHNCHIGMNAVVCALVVICGSVRIGAGAWVSPSASVLNQIPVGDRAIVGMGGVVVKPVADDSIVIGNPAKPLIKKA